MYYSCSAQDTKIDLILKLLDAFYVEIHFRFLESKEGEVLGVKIKNNQRTYFHAPYCQCAKCPQDLKSKKVNYLNFVLNNLEKSVSFVIESSGSHFLFCICEECGNKKILEFTIKMFKKEMFEELKNSDFTREDLMSVENHPANLKKWIDTKIEKAVSVVKSAKRFRKHDF